MPINKQQKEQMLQMLKEKMSSSQIIVMADYKGIDVQAMTKLRRKMRESGGELKVAKNTIIKIAARELGLEGADPYLEGPTALAFGMDDPVAPAKVMNDFIKENKKLEIKAAILEGHIIDAAQVKDLANLPSREVLLAKVLGGMQAPMYGFAGALQGLLRNLVYVLDAVREKKAGEAAS
ncbi:50S ribosomal protein L10 [Desulfallas thermosapovorans]|uniref:Large ribosomal subunit protein uL10 n=1 Tax=Desulfallas thermosapovorans DSM 6562 TaxID=1121431 RepID=A0A5S4ZN47_9FIRM|nr:50S ribosomal protein L10 [Desulfallas thermosapovorans]TYO92712.1 LSU ribosomal protein L10P [Desulfallas thermosapovorans DSM 6562]